MKYLLLYTIFILFLFCCYIVIASAYRMLCVYFIYLPAKIFLIVIQISFRNEIWKRQSSGTSYRNILDLHNRGLFHRIFPEDRYMLPYIAMSHGQNSDYLYFDYCFTKYVCSIADLTI